MVDLNQAYSETKSLPDNVLRREMASPSGALPSWIVASELSERQAIRGGGYQRKPSIAQQIMQRANSMMPSPENNDWGIPADAKLEQPTYAPQGMSPQMGGPSPQGITPPVQGYAEGGLVKQEEPKAPAIVPSASPGDFASSMAGFRHGSGDHAPTGLQMVQAMGIVPNGQNIRTSDAGALKVAMDTNQTLQSVKDRASFFDGLQDVASMDRGWNTATLPPIKEPLLPARTSIMGNYAEGGIVKRLNPFIALTQGMSDQEFAGNIQSEEAMEKNAGYMPTAGLQAAQALGNTRNLSSLTPQASNQPERLMGLGAFGR